MSLLFILAFEWVSFDLEHSGTSGGIQNMTCRMQNEKALILQYFYQFLTPISFMPFTTRFLSLWSKFLLFSPGLATFYYFLLPTNH